MAMVKGVEDEIAVVVAQALLERLSADLDLFAKDEVDPDELREMWEMMSSLVEDFAEHVDG
jgi:hypothetical protein